jgi:mono/diheme cytochrome c family protein
MMLVLGRTLVVVACSLVLAGQAFGQAPATDEATVERGRTVYQNWCAPCHSAGRGNPGTAALAAKYKGKQPAVAAVLEDRTDLTAASIRFFVRQGVSVMAPFRKTEITDADLDAMTAYLTRRKTP